MRPVVGDAVSSLSITVKVKLINLGVFVASTEVGIKYKEFSELCDFNSTK